MRYRTAATLSPFVLLAVAACGDPASSGDALTEAEAAELAAAIAESGFLTPPAGASAHQSPAGPADRITITINETAPCEAGGTAALSGSVTVDFDQQTGAGTMELNYTMTPSNCAVRTESGRVFTLSGDPNLKVTGQFNISETSFGGSITYEGGFAWRADDGRAGGCRMNMRATYDFSLTETTMNGTATISGEVCGHSVNRTITVTASA
ncbi:hypothetical protein HRbin33_01244 [bacterium HR33]|nr:hypothetical protein HRbin33_01244 [bacterium HR33]